MRRHAAEELERFFAPVAESSSTWARYRPDSAADPDAGSDGDLVHMPPGEGRRFKQDTNTGRYRCVLPTCDGLLWVVAGDKNLHHWRHRSTPAVEHLPETLWHIAAKAVLAQFARAQRPTALIHDDDRYTPSRNKPDVWVLWPASGARPGGDVAFEAQHSGISAPGLKLRTARYINDAIVPVWMFSHLAAPVLGTELHDRAQVRLHEAHKLAAETAPLRWLNPDERTVATAYVSQAIRPDAHRSEDWREGDVKPIVYVRHAGRFDDVVTVSIDRLDDCTLDETGLHTPTDAWIAEQAALADEAETAALAAHAQRVEHLQRESEPVSGPTTAERHRRRTQQPAPRRDPLAGPCPYCGGERVARAEWPHWYRPPSGTAEVVMCSVCDLVLGAVPTG